MKNLCASVSEEMDLQVSIISCSIQNLISQAQRVGEERMKKEPNLESLVNSVKKTTNKTFIQASNVQKYTITKLHLYLKDFSSKITKLNEIREFTTINVSKSGTFEKIEIEFVEKKLLNT
jgi:hypothetical protein